MSKRKEKAFKKWEAKVRQLAKEQGISENKIEIAMEDAYEVFMESGGEDTAGPMSPEAFVQQIANYEDTEQ